jgi:hypothetical protein
MPTEPAADVLLDELRIARLEPQYCAAVDRGDLDVILRICAPDAIECRGERRANIHATAQAMLIGMDRVFAARFHTVTQVVIDVAGDQATSECRYLSRVALRAGPVAGDELFGRAMAAALRDEAGDREIVLVTGGTIRTGYVRSGSWQIRRREVLPEWNACGPSREFFEDGLLAQVRPAPGFDLNT